MAAKIIRLPVRQIHADLPVPSYAHDGDAGLDLFAACDILIQSGSRRILGTGIEIALPSGYVGLVVPRSGLALDHGVTVLNGPGVIDSGFRGEVKVLLVNLGTEAYQVGRGDRVAQLLIVAHASAVIALTDHLPETSRGTGELGSTGR